MTISTLFALLPALFALSGFSAQDDGSRVRTLVIENEVIMRIRVQPAPQVNWVERDGPECVRHRGIRGATLTRDGDVDFLMSGGRRVRAELGDDCPGLSFYDGFYLSPEDERICAGRDPIRSRMGGSCPIERFHQLVPGKR